MKHSRILYNADIPEIIATEKARTLAPDEIELLIDNYDNPELWKELFPGCSNFVNEFLSKVEKWLTGIAVVFQSPDILNVNFMVL